MEARRTKEESTENRLLVTGVERRDIMPKIALTKKSVSHTKIPGRNLHLKQANLRKKNRKRRKENPTPIRIFNRRRPKT